MSDFPPPPPPPPQPPPPPPPPPPGGEAYGVGGSAVPFSIGNAVSYGWNAYWKNVGPMAMLTLVIFVVNLVLNLVGNSTDSFALRFTFTVLGWLIGLLLAFGLIRAALAVTRGETPEVGMLFQPDGFGPYIVATILFGLAVAVGLVLCIIPGIILAVVWMFYGYVLSENPEGMSPTDALSRAAEISKGHRWELFGLAIVLILINFVGLLACGIGLLFTYGITALAIAYAYRSLTGQGVVPAT